MRPSDQNQFKYHFLDKRLVYMAPKGEAPKQQSEKDKTKEKEPIVDLMDYKNIVDFKADRKSTLEDLAKKNVVLATNFEKALEESLDNQGYDGNLDQLWKELETKYKAAKVKVETGRIRFYDKEGLEVAPTFSVVPIRVDLAKFRPDTPRTKYYDPETGLINLKDYKELQSIKAKDIVLNAYDGVKIEITAPGKKPRLATFGDNGKTAYYENNNEVVRIYDGYKLKLIKSSTTPQEEKEQDNYSKASAGEYKFIKKIPKKDDSSTEKEGISAEDYINEAFGLNNPSKIKLEENANLGRIREMAKKGYKIEDYIKFLKDNGAIKKDRIDLLVDIAAEKIQKAADQAKKESEEAIQRTKKKAAELEGLRPKFFMPENLLQKRTFKLSDPKMVEAVGNPDKWNKAWASGNIEGLKVLKGIIESEPDIFGKYSKNPDLLRDRIRDAIARGNDKQINFEDLIDHILDVRMPSFGNKADKNVTDVMSTQEKFSVYFNRLTPGQKSNDQIKKANGLLKKLGNEVYESASVLKVEGNEAIWLNLVFEGHAYTVRVREGGAVGGRETVEIYYFNTTTPYPKGTGYDNGNRYKVSSLTEGDFGPSNKVIEQFRDSVTPKMTFDRFKTVYEINFNKDGTPKGNSLNPEFFTRMKNVIIGGNRFLLQLRDLKYIENAGGETGKESFKSNREVEIKNSQFINLMGQDFKVWLAEWNNPSMEITKILKEIHSTDPLLRTIPSEEFAKRIQDAVTARSNSYVNIGDLLDYVYKDTRMPSHAPEAKEMPKGEKLSEYYGKLKNPSRYQTWAMLFIESLGQESLGRAVVQYDNASNGIYIETTHENHTYKLKFGASAIAAWVNIMTPDGKDYPNSNGYDNYEEFWGNLSPADGPKIKKWFENATRPRVDSYSNFNAEYSRLFDAEGNPKPGVNPQTADQFKTVIESSNRLLKAFEGQRSTIKEKSENSLYSQILRQANLPVQQFETAGFYDADSIISSINSEAIYSLPILKTNTKGVGLQMNDNVLGDGKTDLVTKNKLALFKALFQTYSLEELIAEGVISQGQSKQLPGQEFYVINKLPDRFKTYLNTTETGQPSNFERIIANKFNLDKPEYRESINDNAKLGRYVNLLFPIKESERKYEDVSEAKSKGREDERVYNRMDYTFAHTQFLKDITKEGTINGKIDKGKMIDQINRYLALYDGRLDLQYYKDAAKYRNAYEKAMGGAKYSITEAELDLIINDPTKLAEFNKALHEGFAFAHDQKIDKQREDAQEKLKANYEKWRATLGPEDLAKMEQALKDAKIPDAEIPSVIEKILPIWFAVGFDSVTGQIGLGAGIGYPIPLGQKGEYGTITLGLGTGIGYNYKEQSVGAAIGASIAYTTPKLGPFSLTVGGGPMVGVESKKGIYTGIGFGAGININVTEALGIEANTDVIVTPGLAYIPPNPVLPTGLILPGLTVTLEPNHERTMASTIKEVYKQLGLEGLDQSISAAATPEEKREIIGKQPFFRNALEKAYKSEYPKGFDTIPPEKVLKEYEKFKANIADSVRQNYDPGRRWTFGFGVGPDGKFVVGLGMSVIVSKEVKVAAYEGKSKDVMQQETAINQLASLAERKAAGDKLKPEEEVTLQKGYESGKLVIDPNGKTAKLLPKNIPETKIDQTKPVENIAGLQNRFNEILKPLNLRVEYDQTKKLFEIKFNDWNAHTNYEIAVDSAMQTGGIIFDQGRIYLGSNFKSENPPTILRADYEYPFKKEGKNYLSIITLSDSPNTPAHEIYKSSSKILSSKGGDWYPENGPAYDQYENPKASNILTLNEAEKYKIDDEKLGAGNKLKPSNNSAETEANIKKLSFKEDEFGKPDEKAAIDFAKKFLKVKPIDYRKKSNKETLSNEFDDLNKDLIEFGLKQKPPIDLKQNAAQLNLIRLKIMDESFSELGNIKSPKARQKAFEARLEYTERVIIKPRFKLLIERNHKKYQKDDPRYIRKSADELSRIIMQRVKGIDVNGTQGVVALNQIDRTSTVVGTLNITGFRGNLYGEDNKDQSQVMIGASQDYSKLLKDKPDTAEADIARLIFEETSTAAPHLELKADTPLEANKDKIRELLKADLSQKVISILFNPIMEGLFKTAGGREEIIRLAANKEPASNLSFNEKSRGALSEFQDLVEGIRKAQLSGEEYYSPANNPDYRFKLNHKVQDGVYKKCTNYSMWINEALEAQVRTTKLGSNLDLRAGYGVSTGTTVTKSQLEFTTINVAAAVAFKPPVGEKPPGVVPPKGNPPAAEGGSGQGAGEEVDKTNPVKPNDRVTIPKPKPENPSDTKFDSGGV